MIQDGRTAYYTAIIRLQLNNYIYDIVLKLTKKGIFTYTPFFYVNL